MLRNKERLQTEKRLNLIYCLSSGLIAFGVMVFVYFVKGNSLLGFLGGDSTVLRMDLYHQYGPLVAEVYDRITGGGSLVYSWTSGLGGGFLGNFFNYCGSPFTFLILLLGHKNMPEAIALIIQLKAVLAAACFTYYVNKSRKQPHLLSVPFGLLYAFTGYFVAYSWNIMWLDAMCVFPLVVLGIERIIDEKKPWLFIGALTYTMVTNYYMAYMVVLLCVIYFLYYYFAHYSISFKEEKKRAPEAKYAEGLVVNEAEVLPAAEAQAQAQAAEAPAAADSIDFAPEEFSLDVEDEMVTEKIEAEPEEPAPEPAKKGLRVEKGTSPRQYRFLSAGFMFAFSGFLCFMLAAFALLPVFFCLQSSSATSSSFPKMNQSFYFNLFNFLANHYAGVASTIRSSGNNIVPNVYCGVLTFLLVPFYFLSDRIRGREKVAAAVVLGVFYFSFNNNVLNFIWHGMHYPNDLPYRFSFAYSFFILVMGYKALLHITDFSKKYFVAAGFGMLAFTAVISKVGVQNVGNASMVLTMIMTFVYVLLGGLSLSVRFDRKLLAKLLACAVVFELLVGNTGVYVMQQPKSDYVSDYDDYQSVVAVAEQDDADLFYRTELAKLRARMDPSWFGYNGVSTFSSMAYERTSNLMKALGLFGNNINSYTYYPQTPIFNSIMSLKYVYDNNHLVSENDSYVKVAENEHYQAYKYRYYLPLAFSVDDDVLDWRIGPADPFAVQNDLMTAATGIGNILEEVKATDVTSSNIRDLYLSTVNSGPVFYVSKTDGAKSATVTISVDVAEDGQYYVYVGSLGLSDITVTAGADYSYKYVSSGIQPFTLDLGALKAGDKITAVYTVMESSAAANLNFCCRRLDPEKFGRAYQKILNNGTLRLTSFRDTSFEGELNVSNDDAVIFTSIPYDESWKITVDGRVLAYDHSEPAEKRFFGIFTYKPEPVSGDVFAVGQGLIGFKIDKGAHQIRFEYHAKGLKPGLALTGIGAVILAGAILVSVVRRRKNKAGA